MLTELESGEAVRRYLALPATMSMNARHNQVAEEMTYDTRIVSRFQVRRALERHEENGGATAMSKRHVNQKIKAIAPGKRRKSYRAMPLSTKTAVVEWALSICTLTGNQIRDEIHSDGHGQWGYSTITRTRREAGMTRKRTTPAKREACAVQQHMHADQLINLGYLPEHFIFIDETHKAAKDWYLQYGYSWSGCPARIELEGPINLSFSTLAAMTLDGMIGAVQLCQSRVSVALTLLRATRRVADDADGACPRLSSPWSGHGLLHRRLHPLRASVHPTISRAMLRGHARQLKVRCRPALRFSAAQCL